jgi:GAG-pre-integrase domain
MNLLSISQLLLDNPNIILEFSSSSCFFKDHLTKTTILQVPCISGLFSFSPSPSFPRAFLGVRDSADTWHARLGHPSSSTTLHLLHTLNLPFSSSTLSTCHDCMLAKSHKLPFTHLSSTSSPLELVHSDVWSPSPFPHLMVFVIMSYSLMIIPVLHGSILLNTRVKYHICSLFSKDKSKTYYLPQLKHSVPMVEPNTYQFPNIIHQTTCPYTPPTKWLIQTKTSPHY